MRRSAATSEWQDEHAARAVRGRVRRDIQNDLHAERFFIVTHGRSGSSLLAAILNGCGAPFGQRCDHDHWENRTLVRAVRCAHAANQHFRPAMFGYSRFAYRFWRSRAKELLKTALKDAVYSKNRWNTAILPLAERLGYRPVPIVSFRQASDMALSDMGHLKNAATVFMPLILQTYVDSLYALKRYGGIVIDYSELVDPSSQTWAKALGALTGFPASALLAQRNSLVLNRVVRPRVDIWMPAELQEISSHLLDLRNRVLGPIQTPLAMHDSCMVNAEGALPLSPKG